MIDRWLFVVFLYRETNYIVSWREKSLAANSIFIKCYKIQIKFLKLFLGHFYKENNLTWRGKKRNLEKKKRNLRRKKKAKA